MVFHMRSPDGPEVRAVQPKDWQHMRRLGWAFVTPQVFAEYVRGGTAPTPEVAAPDEPEADDVDPLTLTKPKLREWCDAMGIELGDATRVDDMRAIVAEAMGLDFEPKG